MRAFRLILLAGLLVGFGCDRADKDTAERPSSVVEGMEADQKDFGKRPMSVGEDIVAPASQPSKIRITGGTITVAGKLLPLPPAKLTLMRDGIAMLEADSDEQGSNVLALQMTPVTDGSRPWQRAEWRFKLTTSDQESTDGLYVGGAENQLRPLELTVEIERDGPRAKVTLAGKLVPADSPDPLTARVFDISGTLEAGIEEK